MIKNISKNKGIGLIEIMVVISILGIILFVFFKFQTDIFKLNKTVQSGLNTQQNSSKVLEVFVSEVRSSTISNIGNFPISIASTTVVEFYSDTNDDGLAEKISYFKDENKIKRSSIEPKGNPLTYNIDDKKVKDIVSGVENGALPVFEYYDKSYNGSSTSSSLNYPIDLNSITLIKMTLVLDEDTGDLYGPTTITGHAMLRNLKNN